MRLSVHFVGHGCFYRAGEEIDESDVPPAIRNKYAVTVNGRTSQVPAPRARPKRQGKARKHARRYSTLPDNQKPSYSLQ